VVDSPLGPLFELPHAPHYLWLVGLLLAVPAIVISAIGLVRGRLPVALSVSGVILIPIFAYVIGALSVAQESKSVEFCGSCHQPMSPLVASLDQDNGSLASVHWRRGAVSHADACYQCHSGYGIWGTVNAKFAGVRHMIHTVTGHYSFPLEARAFDIASCLGCHAEAVAFRAQEAHRDPELQRQLLAGELSCAGTCHAEAHPADALQGVRAEAAR
jgi:nitrate/TMAO reductase-like tetraheme cytochrome c subunit